MKKNILDNRIKIIVIFVTMFFLTIVSITSNINNKDKEYNLENMSKEYTLQITNNNFEKIQSVCEDCFIKKGGLDEFKTCFDELVVEAGDLVNNTDNIEVKKNRIVKSLVDYSEKDICITYVYNDKLKIEDMYVLESAIPQNDEKIIEKYKIFGKMNVDGIITEPKRDKGFPVIIMIAGSGNIDMNSTIQKTKLFADLADGLANNGYITVRYNKRYYQYSNKAKNEIIKDKVTIQSEYLDDVESVIEYVNKKYKDREIYVIGHSLGAMILPQIADINQEVDGIISLAGSPRKLEDIIYEQNMNYLVQNNIEESQKNQIIAQLNEYVGKIKNNSINKGEIIFGCNGSYWASLTSVNQVEIARRLEVPMLFLHGKEDFQSNIEKDFEEWKRLLFNKTNCTFVSYDNLNHLFMKSNGEKSILEYDSVQKIDSSVVNDICLWIKNN